MNRYFIRRLVIAIPMLLGISAVIFALLNSASHDPLAPFVLDSAVPLEARENIRYPLDLDQLWLIRDGRRVSAAVHGNSGYSLNRRLPVRPLIAERAPATC